MTKELILAAVAGVSLGASSVRAQTGFSFGVEGGMMTGGQGQPDSTRGFAWGLRGGIGLLGPTRLEARYLQASFDSAQGGGALREGDAQLRVGLFRSGLSPYAFGGVGFRIGESEMTGASSDSAIVVPFGGGVDLPLFSRVVVAPEFTWHHMLDAVGSGATSMTQADSWNVSLVVRVDLGG